MKITEQRSEYLKAYRRAHREQIHAQRRDAIRREALADILSVRQLDGGVCIVTANDGREYVIGGRK